MKIHILLCPHILPDRQVSMQQGKTKTVMLNTNIYEQNTFFIQLILTTNALLIVTSIYEFVSAALDKQGCVYIDEMDNLQQNRDLLNWFTCILFSSESKLIQYCV